MKNVIFLVSFTLSTFASCTVYSQQNYQLDNQLENQLEAQLETQQNQQLSEAELAQMLAPIALYPDSLLTHILISATYPLEVIEAHRWLQKNNTLNAAQLAQSIENLDWDPSVKALVPFEQILTRLNDDLSWMQQLGNTFLEDETRVLASIQALREQAKISGNLSKMKNMDVSYEDNNIVIEPVEKEIVYVPYYDTRMVYGAWHWSSFPPVYWRPSHRAYVNRHNPFYWHSGIHISFNYFFSSFHWSKRHVVVINSNKSHHYRSRRAISSSGYAKRWVHQPIHRKGVTYRNKKTHQKYYGNKVKAHKTRTSAKHVQNKLKHRQTHNRHFSSKKERSMVKASRNRDERANAKSHSIQKKPETIASNDKIKSGAGGQKTIQKSVPKQRQNNKTIARNKVRTVPNKTNSVSKRYKHNASSKTHRAKD